MAKYQLLKETAGEGFQPVEEVIEVETPDEAQAFVTQRQTEQGGCWAAKRVE